MKTPISPEQFVRAWQACNSLEEVAQKLDMTKNACKTRASLYRERGVPLKRYLRPWVPDYPSLTALALSLAPAEGETVQGPAGDYLPPDPKPPRKRRACSRCRKPGHTVKTCTAKRQCGTCRVYGHDSRTCPG
jgi:hypothetical protein